MAGSAFLFASVEVLDQEEAEMPEIG